jgi:hypothetical protein
VTDSSDGLFPMASVAPDLLIYGPGDEVRRIGDLGRDEEYIRCKGSTCVTPETPKGKRKILSEFYLDEEGRPRLPCMACAKKREAERRQREIEDDADRTSKACITCHEDKPLSEFYPGYKVCKACWREYLRTRREDPEILARERADSKRRYAEDGGQGQRDRQLKSSWGWSLDGYNEMKAAQGGVCVICGQPETGVIPRMGGDRKLDLAIDHDHEHDPVHPNKKGCPECIRGLLCRDCNVMLGKAGDDVEWFLNAAQYLLEWRLRESAAALAEVMRHLDAIRRLHLG